MKSTSHENIEIKITGLRPGEKLYEELLISGNPEKIDHPKIIRASEEYLTWNNLQEALQGLTMSSLEDGS
jgi:FlaA1/EpsC-like NDP-sugar epimerase